MFIKLVNLCSLGLVDEAKGVCLPLRLLLLGYLGRCLLESAWR